MKPGDVFYLRGDLGDHVDGKSVTVPRGTPAIFRDIFVSHQGFEYARMDVPTSPGQRVLTTALRDMTAVWTREPTPSAWTHVMRNYLDD